MSYGHVERARKLRPIIEQASPSLDDRAASEGVELFPVLQQDGSLVKAGTRIRWGGVLKKAAVDLWDYTENDPDHAPDLWEDVQYKNGYRVLICQISASNPVMPGERCWENDVLYECIYHTACTYRPSEYPAAWEEVPVL